MSPDYKQLQKLEDELIKMDGLMKALQKLLPDGSAHTSVANELENSIARFQSCFYQYWESKLD